MLCKDLMIGDWVLITDTQNYKKKGISVMTEEGVLLSEPLKIYSLYPDTITVGTGQRAVAIVTGDMIEPIPLTPDILERNGFKGGRLSDDYFDISVTEYTESIWVLNYQDTEADFSYNRITICNVHQLQHALKLCGIDKEIEL